MVKWGQSFGSGREKVLEMDGGDGCTTVFTMVKMVNFTLYVSYHSSNVYTCTHTGKLKKKISIFLGWGNFPI